MPKMNNKGFSMVEILISIAIFSVLMVPIVSGIISSMNNTTEAKTLQYRNEFVENMVEYIKQDSLENVMTGEYMQSIGAYNQGAGAAFYYDPNKGTYDKALDPIVKVLGDRSITPTVGPVVNEYTEDPVSGDITYHPHETYMLSGKVNLGTKSETYAYKVQISNQYYATKEMDGTYINPNNLALGIVEDIDHTKVALINGTIANYDASVSNAFLTKKVEILKQYDPDWYLMYTSQQQGANFFPYDTATRLITVKVSGSPTTGYSVKCILKYHDNGESNATVATHLANYDIEYAPFEFIYEVDSETGVATLPNIYLMYNVCLYNGIYSSDDYIALDTSELDDDTKVNLFIVQTAETYSSNVTKANPELIPRDAAGDQLKDEDGNLVYDNLYNDNVMSNIVKREDVRIHLAATEASKLKNVSVYHNFDFDETNTFENTDVNKKNKNVLYSSNHTTGLNSLFNTRFSDSDYKPLITYDASDNKIINESLLNFGRLNNAQEESRGLYEIKVWMVKSDDINDVDTSTNPVMTATKGGNES